MAERCRYPAPGALGGGDGAQGEVRVDDQSADHRRNIVLQKGQTVTLRTPGGGGFGSPEERDPQAIADDVRGGYLEN